MPGDILAGVPKDAFGTGEAPAERLARARAALAAAQAGEGTAGEGTARGTARKGAPDGFGEAAQAGYSAGGSAGWAAGRAVRPRRTRMLPQQPFRTEPSAAEPALPRRTRRPPAPFGAGAGATALDVALGGGLARGTIHEILAGEAGDLGAAHGFALACA
ncbi:hypothetical protein ACTZWW_11970, partial [Salinarimonas sp. NSM]